MAKATGGVLQRACAGACLLASFSLGSAANAQPNASSFKTPEYYKNWGLQYTNAAEAYTLGFTGKGIKIAIADTQLQWSHPQLEQRIYWPNPRYQFPVPGFSKEGQFPEHGTHVAGIAAAEVHRVDKVTYI